MIMFEFSDPAVYLSWLIFLPAVAALVIAFLPARGETLKWISLGATIVVALMSAADAVRRRARAVPGRRRPDAKPVRATTGFRRSTSNI